VSEFFLSLASGAGAILYGNIPGKQIWPGMNPNLELVMVFKVESDQLQTILKALKD